MHRAGAFGGGPWLHGRAAESLDPARLSPLRERAAHTDTVGRRCKAVELHHKKAGAD